MNFVINLSLSSFQEAVTLAKIIGTPKTFLKDKTLLLRATGQAAKTTPKIAVGSRGFTNEEHSVCDSGYVLFSFGFWVVHQNGTFLHNIGFQMYLLLKL